MPVYTYKGVTQAGRSTRGYVDAENSRTARGKLRRDGIFLTDLAEGGAEGAAKHAPTCAGHAMPGTL